MRKLIIALFIIGMGTAFAQPLAEDDMIIKATQLHQALHREQNKINQMQVQLEALVAGQSPAVKTNQTPMASNQTPFPTSAPSEWLGLQLEHWVLVLLASLLLGFVLFDRNHVSKSDIPKKLDPSLSEAEVKCDSELLSISTALNDDQAEYDFLGSNEGCASQLDLAQAYLEMGELNAAYEAIQQVLQQGDAEQKAMAQRLLNLYQAAQR